MEFMEGQQLLEKMRREGKKWAVFTADVQGKSRVCIATVDGALFAMDKEMTEQVIPLLQKAVLHLTPAAAGGPN